MSSTTKLNGVRLGRMIIAGANELASNKQLVDAMNVFPVPDGDTGTNMSLTVMAAAREATLYRWRISQRRHPAEP
mgnify:CR=1 FL=1